MKAHRDHQRRRHDVCRDNENIYTMECFAGAHRVVNESTVLDLDSPAKISAVQGLTDTLHN